MKPPLMNGHSNDFQTPPEALLPILPYLKKEWVIWECASGRGNLANALTTHGYSVISSDIIDGRDFLTWTPPKFDCIITNPPFSIKDKFIQRCYELKTPFALLLPLTTFEGKTRQRLFRENGIQVLFLPKRINFETPSGVGGGSWFATAWFCYGLGLSKDLLFI